jgi:hypothetical protein
MTDTNTAGGTQCSPELARLVRFFESIDAATAARIETLYSADAYFKDPFNEVTGCAAIRRIFEHMFVQVAEPRFAVTTALQSGAEAFLAWDFHFRMRAFDTRTVQLIRGASHVRFAPDGRVEWHRDYWDAAEELYEKLPVVGTLMRWLKRRAG